MISAKIKLEIMQHVKEEYPKDHGYRNITA